MVLAVKLKLEHMMNLPKWILFLIARRKKHHCFCEMALRVYRVFFPLPGSSGGPVVDVNTRSVVGIIRGQTINALGEYKGDAVPSERLFECTLLLSHLTTVFALPGLGKHK